MFRGSNSARESVHYVQRQSYCYFFITPLLIEFFLSSIMQDGYANASEDGYEYDYGYGYDCDYGHDHVNDCILHVINLNAEFS